MAGRSLIKIRAFAKLNLGLRVLGRRADGYHEVHTHLQSIDLADELKIRARADGKIVLEVEPPLGLPVEENLVHRAATLFLRETGIRAGVSLALTKRIPAGAGLGGGSSDAAATLVGLRALFEARVSAEVLARWAAALGSDVPFFLRGGLVCARGRGEVLRPLPPRYAAWHFVVLVPPVKATTAQVYRAWDLREPRAERADVSCAALGLANDLEAAARACYPTLEGLARIVQTAPTPVKGMSGSGSAFFAGFASEGAAAAFGRTLAKSPLQARVLRVRTTQGGFTLERRTSDRQDTW